MWHGSSNPVWAKGEVQGQVETPEAPPPPCLSWGCTALGLHQPSISL